MNLFESILIDIIYLIFPLLCYLLYMFFTKTLEKKEKNLFFLFSLLTSCYLLIKLGKIEYHNMPLLFLDIPLILAYLYKNNISIISLSFLIGFYYYNKFNLNINILVLEYILYFILYLLSIKYKKKYYIEILVFVKVFVFYQFYYFYLSKNNSLIEYSNFVISIILFYIIIKILITMFKNALSLCSLYKSVENIEKDKSTKESLFKITHEIKNPIAVVKGYLDMFDINNINHSKKYIPIIKDEINRVLILLEDFLLISKIKINKEEMDLSMLFEDIIDNFNLILKHKNIKLEHSKLKEVYILADYDRLKQVLVNLIKNSVESIENNGNIYLKYEIVKNKIIITVKDNGIGMTKEELNSLKEAFYTTKKNGTGLGVYLSNEIILKHNGILEYSSIKNKGTIATIKLPYKKRY